MVIENLTKRASKAMWLLATVHEGLTPLMHEVDGKHLEQLFDSLHLIDEAQVELVKILAQDNELEEIED